jgi:phage terminase large subunit GpA-like protein
VHLPKRIEAEWVKQLVAEQLHTVRDRRGFARQEWAKLRERNEALDCAVLARAALWLLGADCYGERFWVRLRDEAADAPLAPSPSPAAPAAASATAPPQAASDTRRPRGWLAPRSSWLRP